MARRCTVAPVLLALIALLASVSKATAAALAPAVTKLLPASGPLAGGTTVSITGSGFTSAATVLFGGVKAPKVVYTSPTSLTATSPAAMRLT